MYYFRLALKNLFRNKLRTLISLSAIAFSVMIVVNLKGLIDGMLSSMVELNIKYNTGHIKIIDSIYERKSKLLSLGYPVDGFDGNGIKAMQEEIENIEGVKNTIPRIKFGAAVSTGEKLVTMMGWGVDIEKEIEFTDIEDYIVEGKMPEKSSSDIIVGKDLLKKLGAKVGEKITIVYTTSWGSFKGSTVKIVGKIDSGFKMMDEMSFYIPLEKAQNVLEMPDMSTELLIEIEKPREMEKTYSEMQTLFSENSEDGRYKLIHWEKGNPLIKLFKISEQIYNVLYVFVILLACIVMINTMRMIIKERTKEIGMLGALGFKTKEILRLFIYEGMVLGIVGSFLGTIVGGITVKIISEVGIDYSKVLEDMSADFLMKPMIYPKFSFGVLVFSFFLGVIITSITALIPAKKAAELQPNEALRYEG